MQNNIDTTITIIGRISSGKSTFAKELSLSHSITIASFGAYLKHYCEMNDLQTDRKTLQQIGDEFIQNKPLIFLSDVITHFGKKSDILIFEGVRHRIIFDELKRISKKHITIFIDADQITRYKRYCEREKDSDINKTWEEFIAIDNHPVELEIETLKNDCNIIVDSTKFNFFDYKDELDRILNTPQLD
jgi:dephospho-CoA kinase